MPIGLSAASVTHHGVIHWFGGNLQADSTRNLPGGLKRRALSRETMASYRIAWAGPCKPPHEKLTCSLHRQSLHILPAWEPPYTLPSSLALLFSSLSHFFFYQPSFYSPSLHLSYFSLHMLSVQLVLFRSIAEPALRIFASKTTAVCFMLNIIIHGLPHLAWEYQILHV